MELFKLLGKIAIDNAEAKKALKETSQEGEKAESKLGKVFGGIGKGAAVVGKTIATGLVAGAGAVTALATAAINSYADYEQLVGGVETLFGTRGAKSVQEYADMVGKSVADVEGEFAMLQEAQSLAMENASNAYKTAGMSANEYMETANGLAAALNQSTGSQLESARLADQAVIDMSDNAAKMGTSMELIQNAYAGFSKQNYTMLDNLKLGYGGTKEEMQRLLDDAGKLANTKFDINNFADVTEAIHVMQEEMGIAGTTATEASGTIQGSFGMLKGAWSNLMTGLSDPNADLQSLINNVFTSVTTFAGNLVPRITQVLTGIATAFQQLVPMLTAEIPNLLNQVLPALIEGAVALVNGVVAALPGIIDALLAALPMLIEGIMSIVDALIGALPQIMEALLGALPTLIPQLIDATVSLIMMLVEMLPQIIQPIIDALPTIIIAITDALLTNLPVLIAGAGQLIVALAAAIPSILGALWEAIKGIFTTLGSKILGFFEPVKNAISNAWNAMGNVPGLAQMKAHIENIWNAIKSHISTCINAAKNVITTVWDAIKNYVMTVLNAIKNNITTAWNAIKTIISNVMKLITSVLKGDWEGVKSAISNILNAIKSVISSIWNGIKSVISSVLNGIKSIVSSIWNGIKSVISSALNTIKTIVTSAWNNIKSAISNVLKGIKTTISNAFKDMASAGKDLARGIWNGISSSLAWIKGKIKGWVGNVTKFIKNLFGIKSPSTVMRDEVGRYIAQGVAVGIEENISEVEKAAEEMNKKVLDAAQKRLDDYKLYNDMTLAEEAGFWDEIRQKFEEGTDARIEADKKYFDAKKSIDEQVLNAEKTFNDKMLDAQKNLNEKLDEIAQKETDRKKEYLNTFDLFSQFNPDDYAKDHDIWSNGLDLTLDLQAQVNSLKMYEDVMDSLESKLGGTELFEELSKYGMDDIEGLQAIDRMTTQELEYYTKLYEERSAIAARMAKDDTEEERVKATQEAYSEYARILTEGIDELDSTYIQLGVELVDSTENLASAFERCTTKIVEAIEDPMAIIHEAWNSLILTDAMVEEFDLSQFIVHNSFGKPSGYSLSNAAYSDAMGTKEDAFNPLAKLLEKNNELMSRWLPAIAEACNIDLFIDGRKFATELAPDMDNALGIISSRKERGR